MNWLCSHKKARKQTQNLHWKLGRLMPSFGFILAVRLKSNCFKPFYFFKIESWIFQHLFEIEFFETSQNFNSFRSFKQLLFSFFSWCLIELKFCEVSASVWKKILWNLAKFHLIQLIQTIVIYIFSLGCLIELKFCEVSPNLFLNRCWKFQLLILKKKKFYS